MPVDTLSHRPVISGGTMAIRARITELGPAQDCVVAPSDAPRCLWVASRLLADPSGREAAAAADLGALVDGVLTEMERSEGVIRFGVLAQPRDDRYFTVSVWRDEAALAAWKESPNHVRAMRSAHAPGAGGPPGFVRWHAPDAEIRWTEVIDRFAAADRAATAAP